MAEDKLIVALSADIKDLKAKLDEANNTLNKFAGNSQTAANKVNSSLSSIGTQITSLVVGYASLATATQVLGASFDRALKLDAVNSSLTAIFNSSEQAGKQFQMLSQFADQYGLNLMAVADSYRNFAASANSANVPLEQTDYIFQSVAKAASVLKLSNDDLRGALNALSQMISKGTVQAEELRGQLGERLPGAFNLAAKAMGVTTQELGKMLENGEVLAGDLLPKLAGELNKTFGDQITGKVDNLQASVNRLDNSFTKAVQSGNLSKFFKELVDGANEFISVIESNTFEEFLGRTVALATGNQFLKNEINATTEALKLQNKELEKTNNVDLTKSFGTSKAVIDIDPNSIEGIKSKIKELENQKVKLNINSQSFIDTTNQITALQAKLKAVEDKITYARVKPLVDFEMPTIEQQALNADIDISGLEYAKKAISDFEAQTNMLNGSLKELAVIGGMAFTPMQIGLAKTSEDLTTINGLQSKLQTLTEQFNATQIGSEQWVLLREQIGLTEQQIASLNLGTNAFQANMQNVVDLVGGALTQSFESALTSGQDFFKVLGQAIKALIARLLAAVAAAAALNILLAVITGGASIGTAAGSFAGILKSLSGFNIGGISGGASQRVVSPVGAGALGQGSVEFNIMGDKLYGVLKNYESRLDRLQ